jgi:two-component system nitrogen regulation sensor histidine kinase NtrY
MTSRFKRILELRTFIVSGIFFLLATILWLNSKEKSLNPKEVQQQLLQVEEEIKAYSNKLILDPPSFERESNTKYLVHVYEGDSLIYWNTNKIPISNFTSIQFPTNGIIRLQNGWYLSHYHQLKNKKVVVSFEIKKEFNYENDFLKNTSTYLLSDCPFDLSLNPNEGAIIKNKKGEYLFSVLTAPDEPKNNPYILVFICAAFIFLLEGIRNKIPETNKNLLKFLGILIILLFFLHLVDFQGVFNGEPFVSAELFGYTGYFSTYLDLCFALIIGPVCFSLIATLIKQLKNHLVLSFIWWVGGFIFLMECSRVIVANSSISFDFLDFFNLTTYSWLILALLGYGFLNLFRSAFFSTFNELKFEKLTLFILGLIFFVFNLFLSRYALFNISIPLLVFVIIWFDSKQGLNNRIRLFLALAIASISIISEFNRNDKIKEKENRLLFAHQLMVDQDINIELAYKDIKEKILKEKLFQQVSEGQTEGMSMADFGYILEKKYFNGSWDLYELGFNLCDTSGKSFFTKDLQFFQNAQNLITKHGAPSEIDSSLFFIKNTTGGYSYILKEKIVEKDTPLILIATLKSKRIPEEIGFPRLLLSKNAGVLTSLEKYSIAKYANNKLIRSFGKFHFPTQTNVFDLKKAKEQRINFEGYNHLFLSENHQHVVLSTKNYSWMDYISSFAVILTLLGALFMLLNIINQDISNYNINFSLSLKIQFAVLLLVLFILLLFATGSGYYVADQFQKNSNKVIEEKLTSIEEELQGKVNLIPLFNVGEHGNFLEAVLVKLARVFETDLNVYDKNGFLVASSRSKIFNQGLLGEQINPTAFQKFKTDNLSFFTQNENIGELNYISSYQPIYNGEQQLLGYINLQHFGQQQEFEEQLRNFLVAVVNVFIILLLISIGITLLVSNWVTSPLKTLQKRISSIQLTSDVKIQYSGKDEIGSLVHAYNLKLDELQVAAKKLAKTEREMAWREMAQQIAHEIKNPLTPMKLSIQQLLRVYDPTEPSSKEKTFRVLNSIIEQIDGLTRIANEFSHFAKIPEPIKSPTELISLIKGVISLFESEEHVTFKFHSDQNETFINLDKEQIVQVFNNLIKNAIQATSLKNKGEIHISITKDYEKTLIEISDNGCGIEKEEQEKIFIPYFTTKSSGSGIGLSVVKQIIESHNGEISFVSEVNKGTTFRIWI